jgi:predicted phage terminase large subunit-like protein
MPTTANPHIDPEEVALAKLELPTLVFAQEYEAAFVTEFGARFKPPARYEYPSEIPKDGYREATGCDFAYTSKAGDWTVFLRGRLVKDALYLTDAYRVQDEINTWTDRLRTEPRPFAFIGGQEKGITDVLKRQGVRISTKPATADKLARAQAVIGAWNRGEIRVPNEAPWLDDVLPEILAFTGDPKIDEHDDVVDALAALHYTLARPGMTSAKTAAKLYR